jgi:putative nucleotidyltransferase with HDIG domain
LTAAGDPLELARATLAGQRAWLVGGAVRDRVRGQRAADLDVVVDGDPAEVARALARAASAQRASAFALSEDYGGWRVVARGGAWQIDVERLRGDSLEDDLALRDFTVNAIAEPLGGPASGTRELIDPLGGLQDLARRRLRATGPRAFAEDPLRVLRLVRIAAELDLEPTPETLHEAAAHAASLRAVSPERVFMELRRILAAARAIAGLELMGDVGATAVVLPELHALRDVEQSRYHHRDVYGHTLEVLEQTIALTAALDTDPAAAPAGGLAVAPPGGAPGAVPDGGSPESTAVFGDHGPALATLLAEPLADELTRAEALRWGALLHDIAKPATREVVADPRARVDRHVTFIGHDRLGAELAQEILGRLRASGRLRAHVAALVRHHLRLGFLLHEPQPLACRAVFAYLRACEPVEVDVTLLSVADRLATRGARSQDAIDAHLRLARTVLADALRWHADGPPAALWRGDELADALGIPLGPRLGELLEELAAARYAGEVSTRAQALDHARHALAAPGGPTIVRP